MRLNNLRAGFYFQIFKFSNLRLFLIGMMGTGKSYWAQRIAASKNIDWMDLDAQIEKEALMTIKEIFETQGEIYFRNKEKEALHQKNRRTTFKILSFDYVDPNAPKNPTNPKGNNTKKEGDEEEE